jgi:hypothetical protein
VVNGPDGSNCRGHVVFSKYEDLDSSSSYLENGAFLSIGHVGYSSEVSEFYLCMCVNWH